VRTSQRGSAIGKFRGILVSLLIIGFAGLLMSLAVALPERFPFGSEVEIMFTRGTITGTLFVTAVKHDP
jgi:hypothetical protein